MTTEYEKTYQIELINEFSNFVYARVLNLVLKQEINTEDKSHFLVILLNQLIDVINIDLFSKTLDELKEIDEYWNTMNSYTKELRNRLEAA